MKVILNCDNTKVKYDIQNFKFKLYRQVISKNPQTGENLITENLILSSKEPGISANSSIKREFIIDIPVEFGIEITNTSLLNLNLPG